jgi:FeS assembly protein IscX
MTWEDSYAIAHALMASYPDARIDEVSLLTLYHWTLDLPDFDDDPALANEAILNAIVQEWLEANPL